MVCKCPSCDGALEYNPGLDKMECPFCGGMFETQDVMSGQNKQDHVVKMTPPSFNGFGAETGTDTNVYAQPQTGDVTQEAENTMECNIYTCTACGAELSVNGVEASTFCAYCGQPTIVFSRVSKELMPKYIVPFRIQKDQAVNGIREKLNKGFFVPREIKNFEVERVRGIYVPYFLFDVYYYDHQRLKGTVGSGKHKKTKYFLREAECEFKRITCDASKQLNDESSQRLEPYDLRVIKPFEAGYLSGFYADRYDMTDKQLTGVAVGRTKAMFDEQMKRSVRASNVHIIESNPSFKIRNAEYALLPAWFMTFRYNNEPYTMLVNGQTGKVVGAVPFAKKKLISMFVIIAILASFICTLLMSALLSSEVDGDIFGFIGIAGFIMYSTGIGAFNSVKKNIELTKAQKTNRFVRDRQEDN